MDCIRHCGHQRRHEDSRMWGRAGQLTLTRLAACVTHHVHHLGLLISLHQHGHYLLSFASLITWSLFLHETKSISGQNSFACASTPRMNGSLQGTTGHVQQAGKEKPDTCEPFAIWEETQANPFLQISGAVTYRERGAKGLYCGCKLLLQSSSKGRAHIHNIRVPAARHINFTDLIGSRLTSASPQQGIGFMQPFPAACLMYFF